MWKAGAVEIRRIATRGEFHVSTAGLQPALPHAARSGGIYQGVVTHRVSPLSCSIGCWEHLMHTVYGTVRYAG